MSTEVKKLERVDRRGILDRGLEKITSRKLLVWGTATGLLLSGGLTAEWWGYLSMAYIGSQGAVDLVTMLKHGK